MSTTASELTQKAKDTFQSESRDVLAFVRSGPNDVFKRVAASLALSPEAQSDCLLYADILNQRGYAGQQAHDDFFNAMFKAICQSFLRILHNGAIEFVGKLTPEAQEQLENIEIWAGERAPRAVEPPPPPAKTAAELLTEEVLRDWKFLSADKVKHKMNNKVYKDEFDRLMAADQLDSLCTTLTDNGKEFRP